MKILSFLFIALGVTLAVYLYAPREVFIPGECFPQDGPCYVQVADNSLVFTVDQESITPITPITYTAQLKGITARGLELLLVGKSMHMDQELIKLDKVNDNLFRAKRVFPKCEEREMVWKGILTVIEPHGNNNQTIKTVFNFRVSRK